MKKTVSFLLSFVLIFTALPMWSITSFAESDDNDTEFDPPTEEKDLVSGDFEFKTHTDGTAEVTWYTGSDETVEIPSTVEGYTVTRITSLGSADTFKGKTLIIPSTVISINEPITSNLPSFYGKKTLENFVVAEENPVFCAVDGVLFSKDMTRIVCYPKGNSRKSYTVPKGVIIIGEGAFWFSENLTELNLPETLIEIEPDGIRGCSGLKNIELPSNLRIIGENAFQKCTNLQSIEIPEGVTEIPFGAFWACYKLANVKLPSTITSIGNYAFAACYPLTEINFPEGLLTMGGMCFSLCSKLTSVTLPRSLQSVKSSVFDDSGLKTIYGYSGSLAEKIANVKGFEFIPLEEPEPLIGDVNFDGIVNTNDYAMVNSYVMCQRHLTKEQLAVADLNNDSVVDAFDVIFLDLIINKAI